MQYAARNPTFDRLVSERVTAIILGISPDTLRRLGSRNKGPKRRQISPRRVGYKLSEVEAYRDRTQVDPAFRRRPKKGGELATSGFKSGRQSPRTINKERNNRRARNR